MDTEINNIEEESEEIKQKIDFKMVTFSLAGRDYGIDIMRVKEISKVKKFTYIPNTYAYVEGVHNLRGEIISIIDLRKMFHLQFYKSGKDNKKTGWKMSSFLNLKTRLLGLLLIQ